jgi:hypothetical protein
MKPKSVGILILVGLLFCIAAIGSASTIQYSDSGTFSALTPTTLFSRPGDTWSFSFQADSNPVVSNVVSGRGFDLTFSNFSYTLNGSPDAITPDFIRFFNASVTGGFAICFSATSPCTDGLGDSGPQMYTQPETGPTLLPGAFTSTPGQFVVAVNGVFYTQPDSTVAASAVPEPSSLLLLGTGLLSLVGMTWRKKLFA